MELTQEAIQAARDSQINEVGTLPPCPMCGVPRCQRSDYVRCNPCGVNWLDGENLDKNPQIERYDKMIKEGRAALRNAG
jgi:hypothetical protein